MPVSEASPPQHFRMGPHLEIRSLQKQSIKVCSLGWTLTQEAWCPFKKGKFGHITHRERKFQVKMRAEMGVMIPQAKEHPSCQKTTSSSGEAWSRLPLPAPRRNQPCPQLDLGLLASRL